MDNKNSCRHYSGDFDSNSVPEFLTETTHLHYISKLASYKNQPFIVGHFEPYAGNSKTEVFNVDTKTWSQMADYPFHDSINGYSAVSIKDSVIIFGGDTIGLSTTTKVAKFTNDQWELIGNLVEKRTGHRAITNGFSVVNVGGREEPAITYLMSTEVWSNANRKTYDGAAQEPLLWDYFEYPELFLVDYKFCTQ